jgi:hypothetical protein
MLPNLPAINSIPQVIGFEVEDKRLGVVGKLNP